MRKTAAELIPRLFYVHVFYFAAKAAAIFNCSLAG